MGDFFAFDGGQKWINAGVVTASTAVQHVKTAYVAVENPLKMTASGMWVFAGSGDTFRHYLIDIAMDPADDPIINNLYCFTGGSRVAFSYYFPLRLPQGCRIHTRIQSTLVSSTLRMGFILCPSSLLSSAFNDCDTYGVSTATSKGTQVTPGSSWAKGSYAALSTGIEAALKGFMVVCTNDATTIGTASRMAVDIATGIGSPTSVIVSNFLLHTSGTWDQHQAKTFGPYMIPVPAGHGLWIRAASSSGSPETFCAALYGLR